MFAKQAQSIALIAVMVVLAVPTAALAGRGIRLTDEARMHPLGQTGVAFDSNPHRQKSGNAFGDLFLILQGGFEIAIPSDRLDVRMSNLVSYHHYLGLSGSNEGGQSTAALSTVKGGTSLQLLGNRRGRVRWGTAAKIHRLDEPEPLNLGVRQGRWRVGGDLFVEWRPGGKALGMKPSVRFTQDSYDASGGVGAAKLDRFAPGARLDFDWRFLPRTQIVLNNAWQWAYYPNDAGANGFADPVSSEVGLMGQVTPRLSAIIAGGYASTQFLLSTQPTGAAQTFTGHVELRYDERRKVTWRLGARRRVLPTTMFGYMTDNSVYARYSERYRHGFRVVSQLTGSLRSFGALTATDVITITEGNERSDLNASLNVSLLWQPKKWWMAGVTERFEYFTTNSAFKQAGVGAEAGTITDPSFGRNLMMLVFEAKY